MKRAPHTSAGLSSRHRKEAECLERKFEREQSEHHPIRVIDLSAWALATRGLS